MVTFDFAKTPITQIADAIIIYSSKNGVSDIHLDPRENGIIVRVRIDGDLVDYAHIPKMYERNLTTRIKLMSNMNITESRLPQDGAIKGNFGGKDLDMRVSCLPTNEGEKIVIRILDYSRSLSGLDKLGFNPTNYQKLLRMIAAPNGIILVTGATGSGKSTTTYSILQVLNKERTNIITVEDPIEMNIEGLNQVQVNSEIGLTFASVLRSILRQDPNVILIGEIRDSETAQIAVRASITGHLVLSTIHTNSSLSTIERLLDMNVEKYLLSSAITGIISQRLAKSLCPKCRIKRKTTPYEKKVFKLSLNKDIEEIFEANHNGCPNCNKGYKGRIAVHEVLEINDEIRNVLNSPVADKDELSRLVYGTGSVITQLQDGLEKILEGLTTFEEIYRIIEVDNEIDENFKIMNRAVAENQRNERKKMEAENQQFIANLERDSQTSISNDAQSIIPNTNVKDQNTVTTSTSATAISKNLIPNPVVNKETVSTTPNNQNTINGNNSSIQPIAVNNQASKSASTVAVVNTNNKVQTPSTTQPNSVTPSQQAPVIPVMNMNTPVKAVTPTPPVNNNINIPTFNT